MQTVSYGLTGVLSHHILPPKHSFPQWHGHFNILTSVLTTPLS